jgi:hypothetical protein
MPDGNAAEKGAEPILFGAGYAVVERRRWWDVQGL